MNKVYFIGIGGIGMSAIARYFLSKGYLVGGYDLTPSPLTEDLSKEGAYIHYEDDIDLIPEELRLEDTLVVYTPAIPSSHRELIYFQTHNHKVFKRSEILGEITRIERALCVAGTHGKTTTSTMLAHLLKQSHLDCKAFLGGISNNYNSNLLLSEKSDLVVIEADEFDRSFHRLSPYMSIITSADPDHLDIYGNEEAYQESFEYYTSLIQPNGVLLMHESVKITPRLQDNVRLYRYATDRNSDFYASNIQIIDAQLFFEWHYPSLGTTPAGSMTVELGVPLRINVDNAVAAMAIAYLNGVTLSELQRGIKSFKGAKRRFDRVLQNEMHILIDDYAHHPIELEASIQSVRSLYPSKKILGIFQPHLYSRTNDFYKEFASTLDHLDEVILLDIYPAREEPMEGVTSKLIAQNMLNSNCIVMSKEELLKHLEGLKKEDNLCELILMVGAGDIDRLVPMVAELLQK